MATSIVWADVLGVAPELSTVSALGQTDILAYVNEAFVVDEWGGDASKLLRLARIYLAAHYGTVSVQGSAGAAGPVIGESAGGLSRQYASNSPMGTDPLFDTTPYGKAFRNLARRSSGRAPVVL